MAEYVTKQEMDEAITSAKMELIERIEKSETTLLKEFRKWAVRIESPLKATQVLVGGFNERLSVLEERIEELERGRR